MFELYKWVPGYEGLYKVSNLGNVKSYKRKEEALLKPRKHNKGYFKVSLFKKGRKVQFFIHRLVSLTFKGKPPEGKPYVRHYDGNPENNELSNLRFGDQSDNEKDKKRHGRFNHRVHGRLITA